METSLIVLSSLLPSLGLLVLTLFFTRKRVVSKSDQEQTSLNQLEEVVKTAQLTNDGFFRSLELVQKNLESLLVRAETAEQRLRSLMLQPGVEKKEQYTAAALLLNEGQEPPRVAAMLNLPLPQVQIVRELQKMAVKERRTTSRRKRDENPSTPEAPIKNAGPQEKNAEEPILLVDVIKTAANGATAQVPVQDIGIA
jgi:hypothetical protein